MASRFTLPACRIAILGLCICTLGTGGCSYLFVDGPPKQHQQLPYFTCSTSKGWPVVDTVIGSIYGIESAVMLAASASSKGSSDGNSETEIGVGLGLTAAGLATLFIASAVSGYHDVSECREATENLQLRLMRSYPGPGFAPNPNAPAPKADPWVRPMDRPFGTPTPREVKDGDAPAAETPNDER